MNEMGMALSEKLIKTAAQIGLERLDLCSRLARERILPAVRVCYGVDDRQRAEAFGTCFLLRVSGRPFLVTAAHVIDKNKYTTIYIGGAGNLVQLEATFLATEAPREVRANDHFDFAFTELTDSQCTDLSANVLIDESEVSSNQAPSQDRFYMAVGYPAARQRVVWGQTVVRTDPWTYIGVDRPRPELSEKLSVDQPTHFFLGYDKYAKTFDGNLQNAIQPAGSSGGVLVDLGPMGLDQYRRESPCVALLAGVLIEHHANHKAILAVKIQLVLEQIRRHLNR